MLVPNVGQININHHHHHVVGAAHRRGSSGTVDPGAKRSCSLAIGETVILLHPPLPLVVVSIETMRECQQNDSLADGYCSPLMTGRRPRLGPGEAGPPELGARAEPAVGGGRSAIISPGSSQLVSPRQTGGAGLLPCPAPGPRVYQNWRLEPSSSANAAASLLTRFLAVEIRHARP